MTAKEKPKKEKQEKRFFFLLCAPKNVFLLSVPKSLSLSRNPVRDWLVELIFLSTEVHRAALVLEKWTSSLEKSIEGSRARTKVNWKSIFELIALGLLVSHQPLDESVISRVRRDFEPSVGWRGLGHPARRRFRSQLAADHHPGNYRECSASAFEAIFSFVVRQQVVIRPSVAFTEDKNKLNPIRVMMMPCDAMFIGHNKRDCDGGRSDVRRETSTRVFFLPHEKFSSTTRKRRRDFYERKDDRARRLSHA